jgi:hypothetical protein
MAEQPNHGHTPPIHGEPMSVPQVGESATAPILPVAEATPDEGSHEDWEELEKALPTHDQLIASAKKHRAPQSWYDEDHKAV